MIENNKPIKVRAREVRALDRLLNILRDNKVPDPEERRDAVLQLHSLPSHVLDTALPRIVELAAWEKDTRVQTGLIKAIRIVGLSDKSVLQAITALKTLEPHTNSDDTMLELARAIHYLRKNALESYSVKAIQKAASVAA